MKSEFWLEQLGPEDSSLRGRYGRTEFAERR